MFSKLTFTEADIFDKKVIQNNQRCVEKRICDFNNQSEARKPKVDYKTTSEIGLVTQ